MVETISAAYANAPILDHIMLALKGLEGACSDPRVVQLGHVETEQYRKIEITFWDQLASTNRKFTSSNRKFTSTFMVDFPAW